MPSPRRDLILAGYIPSLPSPFDASGNIDRPAFEHLCRRQIEAGAPALVVGATTGEGPTLTPTEHRVLIHCAVDVAQGRVPIIAGAGSNSTAHALDLTHDAERLGAAAVLSVVPYYNKPPQRGLIAHFTSIRRSTSLPIILHDAPSRCAVGLSDASVAELAASSSQFVGLKDGSGDVTRPARLRAMIRTTFQLLSGDDTTAFAFQALGGDGCISVTSNVIPQICRAMATALRQGDMDRAQRLAAPVGQVSAALAQESDPVPVKFALSLLGAMAATVRLPLVELGASAKAEIADVILQIRQQYPDAVLSRNGLASPPSDCNRLRVGAR